MRSNETLCKICGSSDNFILYQKDGYDIIKCDNCKIIFTKIPENFNLLNIYDLSYFQGGQQYGYSNYANSKNVLKKEFSKSVKLLKSLTNNQKGLKLLELGSAYGFFLNEAVNSFDCIGVEVSKEAAEYSIRNGHKVFTDIYSEEIADKIGLVDIVAMFDVIEHLPDPKKTIQIIDKHLKKGGLIVITTGNIDSLLARITRKKWRLMTPPQHTFFFSKKTITNIFNTLHYKFEVLDRPWKTIPLGLAVYQVCSRLGFRIHNHNNLNRISVTVNLFDTIRIIARKL